MTAPPRPVDIQTPRNEIIAYVQGILDGDGYVDRNRIGLTVKDKIFSDSFIQAMIQLGYSPQKVRIIKRNQSTPLGHSNSVLYQARVTIGVDGLKEIEEFQPTAEATAMAYLRGLYESDGGYYIIRYPDRECHQLQIWNGNPGVLTKAEHLSKLIDVHFTRRQDNFCEVIYNQRRIEITRFLEKVQPCMKRGERRRHLLGEDYRP